MSAPESRTTNQNTRDCRMNCPEIIGAACARGALFRMGDEATVEKKPSAETLLAAAEHATSWETVAFDVVTETGCRGTTENGDCAQQPAMRAAKATMGFALAMARLEVSGGSADLPAPQQSPHQYPER
jgi:hypothetical protein